MSSPDNPRSSVKHSTMGDSLGLNESGKTALQEISLTDFKKKMALKYHESYS